MSIHNLDLTWYENSSPPFGIKDNKMYMYEAEISVAMYLWKKGMGVVYEANKNDQGNIFRAYDVAIEQCT